MPSPSQELFFGSGGHHTGVVETARSALSGEPLELIVDTTHPRLPGMSQGLVGVAEGQTVTVHVTAERAYGMPAPTRTRCVDRARFHTDEELVASRCARMRLGRGRTRSVLVVEVHEEEVIVDTNHPRCG